MSKFDLCETEINIMKDLNDDKLEWGAAVGACWKNLVAHGYVEPNFGPITDKGKEFVKQVRCGEE